MTVHRRKKKAQRKEGDRPDAHRVTGIERRWGRED